MLNLVWNASNVDLIHVDNREEHVKCLQESKTIKISVAFFQPDSCHTQYEDLTKAQQSVFEEFVNLNHYIHIRLTNTRIFNERAKTVCRKNR